MRIIFGFVFALSFVIASCHSERTTLSQEKDIVADLVASGIEIEVDDLRWVDTTPDHRVSRIDGLRDAESRSQSNLNRQPLHDSVSETLEEGDRQDLSLQKDLVEKGSESKPLIETRRDLLAHLVGPGGVARMRGARLFQHVDTFPSHKRYAGSEFDTVRKAINGKCASPAKRFKNFVLSEFSAALKEQDGWDRDIDAFRFANVARDFGEHCLKKLNLVSKEVRDATGVLVLDKWVFCSATAISENRILTSRHCFFHEFTGALRRRQYNGLLRGQIAYHPNNGDSSRTLEPGKANTLKDVAYHPNEDMIELDLRGSVQHFIPKEASGIPQAGIAPIEAWLVGNHPTVLPLNNGVLAQVRGATPIACAILELTAEHCIYHVCQSSETTSGGSLLIQTANGLRVVGVHRGTIDVAAGCEPNAADLTELTKHQINIAAYLR